jgi:hypothetical protein
MWLDILAARLLGEDQQRFSSIRDQLATFMTPAQVRDAQKRAREWLQSFERRSH